MSSQCIQISFPPNIRPKTLLLLVLACREVFWHGKLCQDQNGAKCAECQHVTSSKIHINIFDIKISPTKIAPLHSQVLTSTNVAPVKKSSS
jgi:hypothetical protein